MMHKDMLYTVFLELQESFAYCPTVIRCLVKQNSNKISLQWDFLAQLILVLNSNMVKNKLQVFPSTPGTG